ncbi:MAG: hypothetical protein AB7V06_28290 [Candidatus Obscuribacterales bacterium]
MNQFGFDEADWSAAKFEAKNAMIAKAKLRRVIPYSDLVNKITSISLQPRDPRLFHLLGEISTEEATAGRGMLTAIVVHKSGDMQPGPGFFDLAKRLGRDVSNIEKCWINEINEVYKQWSESH